MLFSKCLISQWLNTVPLDLAVMAWSQLLGRAASSVLRDICDS